MLRLPRFLWPGAVLLGVVDTDTIDVRLELDAAFGRRLVHDQRLRLARIDGWKRGTERGEAGAAFVHGALSRAPFAVETLKPYKYGGAQAAAEYMGEVILHDGRNLSDELLSAGLALPYDGRGRRPTEAQEPRAG